MFDMAETLPSFDALLAALRARPLTAENDPEHPASIHLADLCEAHLASIDLFGGMREEMPLYENQPSGAQVLRRLAFATKPVRKDPAQVLLDEEYGNKPIFLIVDGLVKVFRETETPRRKIKTAFLGFRSKGNHIGVPNAALQRIHFYTSRTCVRSDLLKVSSEAFRQAHAASPQLARNVLNAFVDRLYDEAEDREAFLTADFPGRAALMFLLIAEALGYKDSEPTKPIELSWLQREEIEKHVHIRDRTLTRVLKALKNSGAIDFVKTQHGHQFSITSVEKLRRILELQL